MLRLARGRACGLEGGRRAGRSDGQALKFVCVRFSGAGFGIGGFVYVLVVRLRLVVVTEYHVNCCVVIFMVVEVVGCVEVRGVRKVR